MVCSSPLASGGFRRFEASIAPSAAPAPTMVCSSSMKRMIFPFARSISRITAFIRSSNSPRYFVPAMRDPKSSETSSLFFSDSGTSPDAIFKASPSTIAVFPTPASPMRTGLFFVLRERTCISLRISSSRPMTGSSFSSRAMRVRFLPYFSKTAYFDSGSASVIRCPPRSPCSAFKISSRSIFDD